MAGLLGLIQVEVRIQSADTGTRCWGACSAGEKNAQVSYTGRGTESGGGRISLEKVRLGRHGGFGALRGQH